MTIRVLVVDDSAVVRSVLVRELSREPDIEVVGTAPDPYAAREQILKLEPDVVTLDMEMPRMDGLTFLRKLMHFHPVPVVVVSSITPEGSLVAVEALRCGAVDVVCKPAAGDVNGLQRRLVESIRLAAQVSARRNLAAQPPVAAPSPVLSLPLSSAQTFFAIGASTGGPRALEEVLTRMPANAPPIAVVQHMPAGFTRALADRLTSVCAIEVREAANGDRFHAGLALIAPGNYHLLVRASADGYRADVRDGPVVSRHRPSVDVMFRSVARAAGRHAVAALLTGMGADGAKGLKEIRDAGGFTVAQDEATSVVYGMPREAAELGAAMRIEPLDRVAQTLLRGPSLDKTPAA